MFASLNKMQPHFVKNGFKYVIKNHFRNVLDVKELKFRLGLLCCFVVLVVVISSICGIIGKNLNTESYYASIDYPNAFGYAKKPYFGLVTDNTLAFFFVFRLYRPDLVAVGYIISFTFTLACSFLLPRRYAVCFIIMFAGMFSNAFSRLCFNNLDGQPLMSSYVHNELKFGWCNYNVHTEKPSFVHTIQPYSVMDYFMFASSCYSFGDVVVMFAGLMLGLNFVFKAGYRCTTFSAFYIKNKQGKANNFIKIKQIRIIRL